MGVDEIRDLLAVLKAAGVQSFRYGEIAVSFGPAPGQGSPRPVEDPQRQLIADLGLNPVAFGLSDG